MDGCEEAGGEVGEEGWTLRWFFDVVKEKKGR